MTKILILSCHGGGGHTSAAQALTSILKDSYQVETVDIAGKELAYIDPFYWMTAKKYTGQDLYNFLLRRNHKRLINFFFHIGLIMIRLRKKGIIKGFKHIFSVKKPDLVISVIPLFNEYILIAADFYAIPCIIIPTDLDVRTFVNNLPIPAVGKTVLGLAFKYEELTSLILPEIKKAYPIQYIGFPVKPSFLQPKDSKKIKQSFNIQEKKPVVLLIMGAAGSIATKKYVRYIFKSAQSLHLIVCVGRAHYLKQSLEKLTPPAHINMTVLDEQADVADIMAITTVCITKPGSVTFAEVLYMHIPVLIDNTTPALIWEKLNLNFTLEHQIGGFIKSYDEIVPLLEEYLSNPEKIRHIKQNYLKLNQRKITQELPSLVHEILT